MTKITLAGLKVGQIWESRLGFQRVITKLEGDKITTNSNNSHEKTAKYNLRLFTWGSSSYFIDSCCAKLISEPKTARFAIGQKWRSTQGTIRNVVTIGPNHVGLREDGFGIQTYLVEDWLLNNICAEEVKPVQKYWVNLFRSTNPESVQAGQLYRGKNEANQSPSATNRIACIEVKFTEGEGL